MTAAARYFAYCCWRIQDFPALQKLDCLAPLQYSDAPYYYHDSSIRGTGLRSAAGVTGSTL